MWELRPLSATAVFTMIKSREYKTELSKPHNTRTKNGAPNPHEYKVRIRVN